MKIEDDVIARLRLLPEDRQAEVLRFIERVEVESRDTSRAQRESCRLKASMHWISKHRAEFAGRWVSLDGDRLVASGEDAKSVFDAAREAGVAVPFLEQVSEDEGAFMAGWL